MTTSTTPTATRYPTLNHPAPAGSRGLLGEDFFINVVGLEAGRADDAVLERLGSLTSLASLEIHGDEITDAGLAHPRV